MPSFWSSLSGLLPIGGAVIGNLVAPGVGGALGGLLGSGLATGLNAASSSDIEDMIKRLESQAYGTAQSWDMPFYNQLLQSAEQGVNTSFNKSQRDLLGYLAGSGLGKAGVGAAALTDLQSKRAQALNQAIAGVNEQDLRWKMGLITELLGLGGKGMELQNQTDLLAGQGLGNLTGQFLMRYLFGPQASVAGAGGAAAAGATDLGFGPWLPGLVENIGY